MIAPATYWYLPPTERVRTRTREREVNGRVGRGAGGHDVRTQEDRDAQHRPDDGHESAGGGGRNESTRGQHGEREAGE